MSLPVRYLYLATDGFPGTSFDTHVLEHLRVMAGLGVRFDLFVFENALIAPRRPIRKLQRFWELRTEIEGAASYHLYLTSMFALDRWLPRVELLSMLKLRGIPRETPLLVHTRAPAGVRIAQALRRWYPQARVVLEIRKDSAALLRERIEREGRRPTLIEQGRIKHLENEEAEALGLAHGALVASEAMKAKLRTAHGLESKLISVLPTVASDERFPFSDELREEGRYILGLRNEFALLYSGSLTDYQWVDQVVRLTADLMGRRPDVYFILLTPEVERARLLVAERLPPGRFAVMSAEHREVALWLNAADAGWLIRESSPANRVASPTKYAEQLMCGLPLILSKGIGDYSGFTEEHRTGILVEDLSSAREIDARWEELRALSGIDERARIAALARQHLSREKHAPMLLDFYQRVLDS